MKTLDMELFAKRLREARKDKGWTQKTLSEETGISVAMLSAYENPEAKAGKNPSLATAYILANALDVPIDWLCGLDDRNTHQNTEIILTSLLSFIFDNPYRTNIKREWRENPNATDSRDGIMLCWLEAVVEDSSLMSEFLSKAIELKLIAQKDILTSDMLETLKKNLIDRYSNIEWKSLICYNDCKEGDFYGDDQTEE